MLHRSASHHLFEQALTAIPGGVNSPVRAFRAVGGEPFFVRRAYGCHIEDVDGHEYVDYVCTWGPAILGHAPEEVLKAVTEAASRGLSFGIPNPYEVEMAETIRRLVPSVEKVRMVNSGTEAVMSAIRLARGFTGRERILKFAGCYHGHVDSLLVKAGSGALTHGAPDSAGIPESLARLTINIPFNDLAAVEAVFAEVGGEIAGVIVEPVPANAGLYLPKPGFLEGLRALCDRYQSLLIFDEVMTGFRLAPGGAQELFGVRPDLSTFGKVIGGGLPVGAFGGRREIMDHLSPLGPVYQAGTLSGNPLAMAAGLAQLRTLERDNGWQRLDDLGLEMRKRVEQALSRSRIEATFQQIGSMFCLYFTGDPVSSLEDALRSDRDRFRRFFHGCLEQGVYFAPSPFEAGFLSLAHTEAVLDRTGRVMEEVLCRL